MSNNVCFLKEKFISSYSNIFFYHNRFTSGIYFQLMNIASSDYDEFISTLRTARAAFQMTPGGHLQFNDLLQKLKRTKSCKKELWQQITNAMQST